MRSEEEEMRFKANIQNAGVFSRMFLFLFFSFSFGFVLLLLLLLLTMLVVIGGDWW